MKARAFALNLLAAVQAAERAEDFTTGVVSEAFADVVLVPFKAARAWMLEHGFQLLPSAGDRSIGMLQPKHHVMITIQPAFGGLVETGFPEGLPQQISSMVTLGFADLQRRARAPRKNPTGRRPPRPGTLSAWMRDVNSILLKEQGVGTWQLSPKQSYESWFVTGMRPSTAANILIDGLSTGQITVRRRRRRR